MSALATEKHSSPVIQLVYT